MKSRTYSGFTLIEMMIVIAIIGLIVGGTVLKIGDSAGERQARAAAEQLALLTKALAEKAILDDQLYGLLLTQTQYDFVIFDPVTQTWQLLQGERLFARYDLPSNITLNWTVAGRSNAILTTVLDPFMPQIQFSPLGIASPFSVRFLLRNVAVNQVESMPNGQILLDDLAI